MGGTDLYWITEEIPFAKEQVLPYHLNSLFTPQGMIIRTLYTSPRGGTERILRRIVPGPIAPILPRLRNLDFGTLDSLQYADERLNQHLQGKVLEQNPIAPDFSYYPVQSKAPINLYSKKDQGKFLLLDLWGTWCGPCLREMPKVRAFQEEHAAVLEVISLNRGDNRADYVEGFIKKYNMNWSQAYAGNLLNDFLNPKKSVPYAVLLDSEMKVRWTGNPAGNWEKIEGIIRGN
jgi:thiol-disulfide isomerase/thioredoxin